jgi:hypothetical protein
VKKNGLISTLDCKGTIFLGSIKPLFTSKNRVEIGKNFSLFSSMLLLAKLLGLLCLAPDEEASIDIKSD